MRTFGCEEFVHIDKDDRTNIEAISKKCTFIGYMVDDFGYRLWDFENCKIINTISNKGTFLSLCIKLCSIFLINMEKGLTMKRH